jgi:putative transposase
MQIIVQSVAESDEQKFMAQTLVSLYIHVIFSTKNRNELITPEIEPDLFSYIGGILNNNKSKLLTANGTRDHVHLLISLSKNIGLSELVGDIKRDSSVWIKKQDSQFGSFHWQDGYGAFSIGQSQIKIVKDYIAKQKIKHTKIDFKNEFRNFLQKYEMEYDEQYVWD